MDDARAALPPGWIRVTDPNTGRVYNANPTTQETRWDPPPPIGPAAAAAAAAGSEASSSRERSNPSDSSPRHQTSSLPDNKLFSAATTDEYNPAYGNAHKLVSVTRAMLDKATAFPQASIGSDLELHSITPGQIADLCHLQQKKNWMKGEEGQAYTPLNPYTMLTTSQAKETEEARLDARLRSLRRKLERYGGEKPKEGGN